MNPQPTPVGLIRPLHHQTGDASIIEITDGSFAECVAQSKVPVLLAFCADGCRASQGLAALLAGAAPRCNGFVTIAKASPVQCPELAARLGMVSAPSLLLLRGGMVCYEFVGEMSGRELNELLARTGAGHPAAGGPGISPSVTKSPAEP
jgi:thioredoxin 1